MERILLLGGSGILGSEVLRAYQENNFDYVAPRSSDLDIRDKDAVLDYVSNFKPAWIVNCAAWTNVDSAEENFEGACKLNSGAVKNLGEAADLIGSKVIHISTDYVFDGESSEPYRETSKVKPVNRYGESKARGERALEGLDSESYVIRTSWLYGTAGKNFVKTIAGKGLMSIESKVVNDQLGSPTSARDLAQAIMYIVMNRPEPGIYHYSNEGMCSWFDLAESIYKKVGSSASLVQPISSSSLKLLAKRPRYSLLNKDKWKSLGLSSVPHWEESLELLLPEVISELS